MSKGGCVSSSSVLLQQTDVMFALNHRWPPYVGVMTKLVCTTDSSVVCPVQSCQTAALISQTEP